MWNRGRDGHRIRPGSPGFWPPWDQPPSSSSASSPPRRRRRPPTP